MTNKYIQIGVKVLIIDKNSKFIAIKRKSKIGLSFLEEFDIPGGRINFGEEPIDGLRREIQEEIGYSIQKDPILLDARSIINNRDRHIIRLTYFLEDEMIDLSKIKLGNEHSEVKMANIEEDEGFHPILNNAIKIYKKFWKKI